MNTHSKNVKVTCAENCGNSPKKEQLRDLSIAFAQNDIAFCLNHMTEDIIWDIVGNQQVQGIHEYENTLKQMDRHEVQELHIHNIITHGNTGSVNGTLILSDLQKIDFCEVYNYRGFGKNSKIKKITSYYIET